MVETDAATTADAQRAHQRPQGRPRTTIRRIALAGLAACAAMCTIAPASSALTISPLAGTPDASPHSQISFLGILPSELHDVSVVGSRSGSHSGRLAAYASAPGASFLPARPFAEGERVTVSALAGSAHHERRVGSTFTIARLAHYQFTPMRPAPASKPGTVQSFASQPGLTPPSVHVTVRSPASSDEDVFIAANNGYGEWGPMIFDRSGQLVWFKPAPKGETAMDLQVESYEGKPVLVWWQGYIPNLGVGFGTDEIYSSSYQPLASVRAGNGYWADLHDIQITPSGSAFITAYSLVKADLSSVGGAHEGALQDSILQEVDIKTGLVMFEWHAYGHVALDDSYSRGPVSPAMPWDYFHINSISLDPSDDGDLLISSRNTWAGYEIDSHTGQILWRLGGKRSSFHMGAGTGTAWQPTPSRARSTSGSTGATARSRSWDARCAPPRCSPAARATTRRCRAEARSWAGAKCRTSPNSARRVRPSLKRTSPTRESHTAPIRFRGRERQRARPRSRSPRRTRKQAPSMQVGTAPPA
jgi:hypothetical protein